MADRHDGLLILDMHWNVLYDFRYERVHITSKFAPIALQKEYLKARRKAFIIHYAGSEKPWLDRGVDFAKNWWRVAKKTPYADVLKQNCKEIERAEYAKLTFKGRLKKRLRPLASKCFPKGTKRRKVIMKLLGRG